LFKINSKFSLLFLIRESNLLKNSPGLSESLFKAFSKLSSLKAFSTSPYQETTFSFLILLKK
jgi:hypothetical protein